MRFGLDVAQQRMEWDEIVDRTRFAEGLGFEGVWGFDHFQPMYGEGPGNCFEGMATLAALAGATTRIRLGLLVTGVTYRHPSLYTAQAVTIDHASHGRLDMSLGAAWFAPEHHALGMAFPSTGRRFDLLEDTLEVVTRLMTGDTVSYSGKEAQLRDAQLRPLPVQRPHPPIWIGGSGMRRTLPIVAKWADAWHTWGSPDQLAVLSRHIDDLADRAGRDPAAILRASSLSLSEPLDQVRRNVGAMQQVDIGYLVCGWPSEGRSRVEEFARDVMPEFAG
jgi:alkanesulfonate monooxygenase SsuD/methylene tetrahydromethanopterin reductase-like flavin-dependent oxidoreductase (luciferase family)